MRENALRARPRRRGLPKDEGEPATTSPNLLERRFAADAPNRKWIADITYIWTAEGWLYVVAVIDLFSRRVVGWSMQASMHVERTLVWLARFRRLAIRYERRADIHLAFTTLACALGTLNQCRRFC